MQTLLNENDYYCALLEDHDFDLFHTSRTRPELCWEAQETQEDLQEEWDNSFLKHFVLFKRQRLSFNPRDLIIGVCDIKLPLPDEQQVPQFESGILIPRFRKRGLSRLLYEARFKYLVSQTDFNLAHLFIEADNEDSILAASARGFTVASPSFLSHEEPLILFERGLDDFRQVQPDFRPEAFG